MTNYPEDKPTVTVDEMVTARDDTPRYMVEGSILRAVFQNSAVVVEDDDGELLIPTFQLTEDLRWDERMAGPIRSLLELGMGPHMVWHWLTIPSTKLNGRSVAQAVQDGDERLVAKVIANVKWAVETA